jgi:RNase adapter protein RapZ
MVFAIVPVMKALNLTIITGLSGSGKSTAINALEDAGYFCVDNMPVRLLPKFLELQAGSASEVQKLALGMDLRQEEFAREYPDIFGQLRHGGYKVEILFLEASEETLLKRYSQTRRHHPVVSAGGSLVDSIRTEMAQLKDLKQVADRVIDTTNLTVHQLKDLIVKHVEHGLETEHMRISVLSFGFKYGIPLEADLLMDVRFLPNPYFLPELKKLDGMDERVKNFVNKWPETGEFLDRYQDLLEYLIPMYEKEGKSYLTLAVGCTGGRHRSVTIAEEICRRLRVLNREVTLSHRDIELA